MNNISSSTAEGFLPMLRRVPLGLATALFIVLSTLWSVLGYRFAFNLTDYTTGYIIVSIVTLLISLPFWVIVLSHSFTSRIGKVMGFVAIGVYFVASLLTLIFSDTPFIGLAIVPMYILGCLFSSSHYRWAWILVAVGSFFGSLSWAMLDCFADKTLPYLGATSFRYILWYAGLLAFLYLGLVSARPESERKPLLAGDTLTTFALPRIFAIVSMILLVVAIVLLVVMTLGSGVDSRYSWESSWSYGFSSRYYDIEALIPIGMLLALGFHFAVAALLFVFMRVRSMGIKLIGMITLGVGLLLTIFLGAVLIALMDHINDDEAITLYEVVGFSLPLILAVPLWLAKHRAAGHSRAVLSATVAGLVVMSVSMLFLSESNGYLREWVDVSVVNVIVFQIFRPYLFLLVPMLALAFPRLQRRWVFMIMAIFTFMMVMLHFISDILD